MATSIAIQHPTVTVIPGRPEIVDYPRKTAFKLSIAQIACGILALFFQIFGIFVYSELSVVGTGIWCGAIFIIAGILGILGSRVNPSPCHIVTFMVLSIIAVVFSSILMLICIPGILFTVYSFGDNNVYLELVAHLVLLIVSVTELTIGIISSIVCCRAVCSCCKSQSTQGSIYFYPIPVRDANLELPSNGQAVALIAMPSQGNQAYNLYNNVIPGQSVDISVFQRSDGLINLASTTAPPSYDEFFDESQDESKPFQYVSLS